MNIQDITAIQKLATKAYDMIKKYAPEDEWDDDESDSEDEYDDE